MRLAYLSNAAPALLVSASLAFAGGKPQIEHVGMAAPDVVALEIQAGRIVPMRQIPYQPEPEDRVERSVLSRLGEPRAVRVTRRGFPLGLLAGKDRRILSLYESLVGDSLDTRAADLPSNYQISSVDDPNYLLPKTPSAVWRKSRPVDWTENGPPEDQRTAMRHHIYLKLDTPLASGKRYRIRTPGLSLERAIVDYVYDAEVLRSEAVHTSQIGFRPDDAVKVAFLSLWRGSGGGQEYPANLAFHVIDEVTWRHAYSGRARLSWSSENIEGVGLKRNHVGADVHLLDFGSLNTPGRYRVCVEGVGCGFPFEIGADVWPAAFRVSMKGFYHQRLGIPLLPPYTDFIRPRAFHTELDGVTIYQSRCPLLYSGNGLNALSLDRDNFGCLVEGKTGEVVKGLWGGYADAADWDRRIQHLGATRLHLELLELFPGYYGNFSLNIPESANSLPDLLDEALFNLEFYRRGQTPEGGIRGGAESSEHPNLGETSWQDSLVLMTYAPDPWSSYIYAGVAARAALLLRQYDARLAAVYQDSALRAMRWAEAEYERWKQSEEYPKATASAKARLPQERSLAAIELYRLTTEKRWHEALESALAEHRNAEPSGFPLDAAFLYARIENRLADDALRKSAIGAVLSRARQLVELSRQSAFGVTTAPPGRPFGFGGLSQPADKVLIHAHVLTGERVYLDAVERSALFSAGANPLNMTMTTGVGTSFPKNPRHHDSRRTGQAAPAGLTVAGPREFSASSRPPARLERECAPNVMEWPSYETYFDVYGWPGATEFMPSNPMALTSYVWGYLAARR